MVSLANLLKVVIHAKSPMFQIEEMPAGVPCVRLSEKHGEDHAIVWLGVFQRGPGPIRPKAGR